MKRRQFCKNLGIAGLAIANACMVVNSISAKENDRREVQEKMNILVLTGSPRKDGNSNYLASEFIRGAMEKGHHVFRFDAAQSNTHPCIACNACGMDGPCIFDDDFNTVRNHLVPANIVLFATPMYYFGISAQLKTVIDRFYAINGQIHTPKKAALIMTYANGAKKQAKPIESHYETLIDYLGWEDAGQIIVPGVWPAGAVKNTEYPAKAYQLGKSL